MTPHDAATGVSALFLNIGWFFFHLGIPGWLLYEIFVEWGRTKGGLLGYPEDTAKSNVQQMTITLVIYIVILGAFHAN